MPIKTLILAQALFYSSFLQTGLDNNKPLVQIQSPNEVLGDWSRVSRKSILFLRKQKDNKASSSILCNVCPKLIFKASGKGLIGLTNNTLTNFTWYLSDGKISITHNSTLSQNPIIESGIYSVFLKRDTQGHVYLIFNDNKSEQVFIRN